MNILLHIYLTSSAKIEKIFYFELNHIENNLAKQYINKSKVGYCVVQ